MAPFKLGQVKGDTDAEHFYAPNFEQIITTSGTARIVAGVPAGNSLVFETLCDVLSPPYYLLYVLHTPRGEGSPGRYQSPELTHDDLRAFLKRFGPFLAGDARFDVWVYSIKDKGTIIWDRHNRIFAYGDLEAFIAKFRMMGFQMGPSPIPDPHIHHYRQEFDADAAEVLVYFDWMNSPLRPEDEQ